MKHYYIFLCMVFLLGSCHQAETPERYFISKEIKSVELIFVTFDNTMDDLPEDVLYNYNHPEFLDSCIITSTPELLNIQELLSTSLLREDSVETFDTEIVAILHYQDGDVDTLGIPQSVTRGFFYKHQKYENPTLIDLLIRLADHQRRYVKIVQQCYWKGDYKYYSAPFYDKSIHANNYARFSGTQAELLAQLMAQEKYDSIQLLIEKDPTLMYARDPKYDLPILFYSIYFQQDTILRIFLESGFNPNYRKTEPDPNRRIGTNALQPLLFIACENSYYNKCGYLLVEHGADINLCIPWMGPYFSSPLHNAITHRNYEMAKYLIEHGANINIEAQDEYKDNHGNYIKEPVTPLDAALRLRYFKMAYYLMLHGANARTTMIERYGGLNSFITPEDIQHTMPSDRPYIQKIIELYEAQE